MGLASRQAMNIPRDSDQYVHAVQTDTLISTTLALNTEDN